jgi:glucose/arabinose dehydrogenase
MKKTYFIYTFAATLLLASCGNKASESKAPAADADINTPDAPVETQKPNTDYKPAFPGQTRIAGVKTTTPIDAKVITKGLEKPWGIAPLPDGRLLITQKSGTLKIANSAGNLTENITGLPKVDESGQGGLLGITIDPAFDQNRMVYWTFSERVKEGTHTAVAKGKLSPDEKRIENATVIYRATPSYDGDKHYGSRILFDKSGNLMVTTGERSDLATRPQAQDLKSALGKIIRITTDGKPAGTCTPSRNRGFLG